MGTAIRGTVARRNRIAMLCGLVMSTLLAAGLAVVHSPEAAEALSGSEFNPGFIISDSQFYDGNAMSSAEVQNFLVEKGSALSGLSFNVADRAKLVSSKTHNTICEAFKGGEGLAAATIIYRAQMACGISARVILVTLQKEQGLITNSNPSKAALDRAMGYACPDTAPCAPKTLGFGNQVYTGTLQLKIYKAADYLMQPGVHAILWNPTPQCGSKDVKIQNYATAALYNYTPYQPNASALANLRSTGDSCASYGNRNFWVYYNDWFGPSTTVIPAGVAVSRIGGADRYAVAVGISVANFPGTAPVVYVATGATFPDALSAAPAAAKLGGPLLLVQPNYLPQAVKLEIQRLKPASIVVAGGPGSVSDAVYAQLAQLAPAIRRDSGADRYVASRAIAESIFAAEGSKVAYVATGQDFPDALSASAAAASIGAPLLLVPGKSSTLDTATKKLLIKLGVSKVFVAGGVGTVTPAIETQLRAVSGVTTVTRLGGADRYVASSAINRSAFTKSSRVYVASGTTFPDALAGSAVAGAQHAPLYISPHACLPYYMLQDFISYGATSMTILGGTGSVASSVERFAQCP